MKKEKNLVKKQNTSLNNKEIYSLGLNTKRGSELVQTVLITAIMIVIVATMFYPGIEGIFNNSIGKMQTWYDGVMTKMAPVGYM